MPEGQFLLVAMIVTDYQLALRQGIGYSNNDLLMIIFNSLSNSPAELRSK